MKLIIASDVHGSAYYLEKLISHFSAEGADKLVLLGDILYHGPRNDLPKGYDCKKTAELLNDMADKIICVRGNCDTEVDQMMLNFSVLSDSAYIFDGNVGMYLTHGHVFNKDNMPKIQKGTVLACGHFHDSELSQIGEYYYINPGSVSIPKGNKIRSFIVYENSVFTLKSLKEGAKLGTLAIGGDSNE